MRLPRRASLLAVGAIALTSIVSLSIPLAAGAATTGVESILYTFPSGESSSPLIQASNGLFYGTVGNDGANGQGYVFSLTPGGTVAMIYSFTGGADGGTPTSSLIEGNDGKLYGTTTTGSDGNGVLFSMSLGGSIAILHRFVPSDGGTAGSLIETNAGDLFGTASGSTSGIGIVFEYSHAGVFSSFAPTATGFSPNAPLLQASDGLIYGVTAASGSIFRFDPADLTSLTNIADFPLGAPNPIHPPFADPQFGLTEGTDSALYGLTLAGGPAYAGSLYRVALGSVPSVNFDLYDFSNQNSEYPQSGLTLGGDGNLYGSATTVFQFLPADGDTLNTLNSATSDTPYGAPIEGADGNLYGVTALSPTSQVYTLALTPAIPVPIQIATKGGFTTLPSITLGQSITLTWQVNNAFSETMENCWAHGAWSGSQPLTGIEVITPTVTGTLSYALTCGGVESASTAVLVRPAPPTAVFSPASLTFPPTNIGSISAFQNVALTNTGSATLTVSSLLPSGSSFFLPADHQLCGSTLAAGATCTFDVAFEPVAEGPLSGSVVVSGNGSSSSQTLSLSGTGRAAEVSLTPTSIPFVATTVGSISAFVPVTLTNTGNSTLDITSIAPAGPNASSFFLPGDHQLCGSKLAAGASCTFDVAFAPTATGSLSASVQLTDGAADSPQSITVTGTGRVSTATQVGGFTLYEAQPANGQDQFVTFTGTVTSPGGTVNGGTVKIISGSYGIGASGSVSGGQYSIVIDLGYSPGYSGGFPLELYYSGSGIFQPSDGTGTLVIEIPHGN